MKMASKKVKIKRKYSDYYSPRDIQEPDSPIPNLTIENFDNRGLIINPVAPCLAATIDPDYVKECNKPLRIRKFRVKTDILILRDIARTKFFYYSCQESAIEQDQLRERNERVYESIIAFYQFCFDRLNVIESTAFNRMKEKYDTLQKLQKEKPTEERNRLELQHQKMFMLVSDIYRRFRYLLNLITYFDTVSEEAEEIEKFNEVLKKEMGDFLEVIPDKHGTAEAEKLKGYMDNLVKPYLEKKRYVDYDLWWQGYQNIRRKMFNYTRHLSRVALLTHMLSIIHQKSMKVHNLEIKPKLFTKKPELLKARSSFLEQTTKKFLDDWEENFKSNKTNVKIKAIVPTLVNHLGLDKKSINIKDKEDDNILLKIEKIQNYLMNLLTTLDMQDPEICRKAEKDVRRDMARQKELAKQALVKQTRLHNLLYHYKSHNDKKNIVDHYTTLIPRPKGRMYLKSKKKDSVF